MKLTKSAAFYDDMGKNGVFENNVQLAIMLNERSRWKSVRLRGRVTFGILCEGTAIGDNGIWCTM